MKDKSRRPNAASDLRRRAEAAARDSEEGRSQSLDALSPADARRMLHELQVHQIELEMQNEELRRAQQDLDAARARYFDLYDRAPVGYCTLDGDGVFLEANLAAAVLLGVARGALVEQPITRFILPEDQDLLYRHQKQLFETGSPQVCELRVKRQDGAPVWVRLDATLAQMPEGASMGRVAMTDVTERKLAEEDRARLEAELQQAQKMESIGRLAGGVAHDFNNMLGVILGRAEDALERSGPAGPLHEDLEEILTAAKRSADIVGQLLVFARRQTVAPRVLDLNATVAGMLKMLERLIGEHIRLDWRPAADLWPVRVDPTQIDQILTNLCVNARDAIAGSGRLTIETGNSVFDEAACAAHPDVRAGEYVRLAVIDDGRGMDQDVLRHVFEPFFTTKDVGEGTGLGLAMVYGAVRQNNGFIRILTQPDSGTTFTIYLPRHAAAAGQARAEHPEGPQARGPETILLVEDEPAILTMTTLMLEKRGYTVLPAGTPGEAVRLARKHVGTIHLLVTDVVMPEMNGRDLARMLLGLHPDLKYLFMSGYTADVIARHGVVEEGLNFIQKPFSVASLAAKVREALDHG